MSKVLIVEDETIILENLSEIFKISGFEVVCANHGAEAMRVLSEMQQKDDLPSLILTDLMMPFMDGFSLLQAVKASPELRVLPLIVMSARSSSDDLRKAFLMGASDYLIKPFELEELMEMTVKYMGSNYQLSGEQSFRLSC